MHSTLDDKQCSVRKKGSLTFSCTILATTSHVIAIVNERTFKRRVNYFDITMFFSENQKYSKSEWCFYSRTEEVARLDLWVNANTKLPKSTWSSLDIVEGCRIFHLHLSCPKPILYPLEKKFAIAIASLLNVAMVCIVLVLHYWQWWCTMAH